MHKLHKQGHKWMHRLLLGVVLLTAGAVSVTWAWNTILPDLTGLARIRFAEGFAVALVLLMSGALFAAGGRLIGPGDRSRNDDCA